MLHSRFFWKLSLTYVLLVFVTCGTLSLLVYSNWSHSLRTTFAESLRHQVSAILAAQAGRTWSPARLQIQSQIYHRRTGAQLTFLDPEGQVLADSDGEEGDLSWRLEVVAALQGKVGQERRQQGLEEEMLWVAQAGPFGGVVRVGMSTAMEQVPLRSLRRRVALAAGIGMLFALVLGWWVSRWILVPVSEMRLLAESMRREDFDGKVKKFPHNEIGELGQSFNRMRDVLTKKVVHLAREESHLRAILASMVEGVVAVDGDDLVLFSNPAARRLLQHSDSPKLTGSRLWEWTHLRELRGVVEQVRKGEQPTGKQLDFKGGNTQSVVLDVLGAPFGDPDNSGVILVFHDVTNLRRLERVRQDFVANVSHELKTPLTSIKGYIETLLAGALRDEENNERFLRKINKHVVHLTNLVTDLLQLGRIEGGGLEVEIQAVEWNEIVREVLGRHELVLEERRLKLNFERSPQPVLVQGDREAMRQIAENLITNAVKYSREDGAIQVRVQEDGNLGCLEVRDKGVGIPEPDLARIFERFYRVDKARSDGVGSTGLGLSIVKHLVSTLGGEIRVESRLGEGSCFRVGLPLSPQRPGPPA